MSEKKYTVVVVDPRGRANQYGFYSKDSAIEFARLYVWKWQDCSCMVYEAEGKKRRLVWSKLEGMVDGRSRQQNQGRRP